MAKPGWVPVLCTKSTDSGTFQQDSGPWAIDKQEEVNQSAWGLLHELGGMLADFLLANPGTAKDFQLCPATLL